MRIKSTTMDKSLVRKLSVLRARIRKLDSAVVAFSGGVDSSFLMRICRDELGEKAVAVTTLSDTYPRSELTIARRVAKIIGARHVVIDSSKGREARPVRGANVYSTMKSVAMRMQAKNIVDGSHADDACDKGRSYLMARAAGVRSPLLESNLTKAEIRLLAKEFGLPNWDKPSSSSKKRANGAATRAKKPSSAKKAPARAKKAAKRQKAKPGRAKPKRPS